MKKQKQYPSSVADFPRGVNDIPDFPKIDGIEDAAKVRQWILDLGLVTGGGFHPDDDPASIEVSGAAYPKNRVPMFTPEASKLVSERLSSLFEWAERCKPEQALYSNGLPTTPLDCIYSWSIESSQAYQFSLQSQELDTDAFRLELNTRIAFINIESDLAFIKQWTNVAATASMLSLDMLNDPSDSLGKLQVKAAIAYDHFMRSNKATLDRFSRTYRELANYVEYSPSPALVRYLAAVSFAWSNVTK